MGKIDPTRVSERDMVLPTLRLLSEAPSGSLTTSQLIAALTEIFHPTGKDAEIALSRSDTYFSEKVRNMISHRDTNFISQGFADYDPEMAKRTGGLTITHRGRDRVRDAYANL